MIRRPTPGDDENDILRMQEEFIKDKSIQPSAQVVNLRKTEHQTTKRTSPASPELRKLSKYAKSKGFTNEKRKRSEIASGSIVGDILEKNLENKAEPDLENDKVYYPKIIPSILGDIVEKNYECNINLDFKPMPSTGFPVVQKQDSYVKTVSKSVLSQQSVEINIEKEDNMDIEVNHQKEPKVLNIPSQSYLLTNKEADTIHSENVAILSKMDEREILEEQQRLLSTLNPNLVDFIRAKRRQSNKADVILNDSTIETKDIQKMDVLCESAESISDELNDTLWENDVLSHPLIKQWLHCENLEKEKLEWMKGIESSKHVKADEPYQARFNFRGYLLPYTMEYTEDTKTLFHHGEESHRPGYSIIELIELTRSTVVQQRVMALNTLAGVIEYYMAGIYKDIIEIPLSKILFIVRIAMDENKVILLEPALKAMRNLLFNRIDEACLDALLGFDEGNFQPCLENDKSELDEIESKESELKDFHLAEIDLVAAVFRTDLLQRFYYILETVRPSFNCVQYSLQILTRLVRDSTEVASEIVQTEHLMKIIVKHFIPTTSINFSFNVDIVYNGKPILAALKFIRILSLQSREIGGILITKYNILLPLSAYINSGVDGTYGLRIQMEAFSILTNLLHYDLGTDSVLSLCPLVITMLYKHVQCTDIFMKSSVISCTHASIVLQFVNNLLNCKILNLDSFKQQAYPLLKDGVQKWLIQTGHLESYTCGHLRLLCATLDCCRTIISNEKVTLNFLINNLKSLSSSKGFDLIVNNIEQSSNLLSGIADADLHVIKNIVNLGGSVIGVTQKVLPLLNVNSPIPLLASLYKLLVIANDIDLANLFIHKVLHYLQKILKDPPCLINNWFTRLEVDFLFEIVKLSIQSNISELSKDLIYSVASKLCYILRVDKQYELNYLLSNIIFNKQWFTTERLFNLISLTEDGHALTPIEDIKVCYMNVIKINQIEATSNIVFKKWQEPILPRDWIYLPILSLYAKSQDVQRTFVDGNHDAEIAKQRATDQEHIIRCSLEWILFNEISFPDLLIDMDVTDRLCRIMCVFLCDNSLFLDKTINILLRKCTDILYRHGNNFNFDKQLTGLSNFQDFYTQLLEQFQSVSYGDPIFASCVLVPLAQKHNVKWRKLLWSEYAGCLRALDCPEQYLCYAINEYMYPEETDESLIKSYFRALSSNLLRSGTIAYKIALHHVESFKKRLSK